MQKLKSIVVLSGGQDSCTTLALAAQETEVVACLHFQYGQRHSLELRCAEFWAEKFGVPLKVITTDTLAQVAQSSLLQAGDVNAAHPQAGNLPSSFVPGRNLYFLTVAAAQAYSIGATVVYTGVCQTDYSGYPDCREHTIASLQLALKLGMDFHDLEIRTPLMNLSKAETWELADELGVLQEIITQTHTCYNGDRTQTHEWGYGCGTCPACRVRARGWAEFVAAPR